MTGRNTRRQRKKGDTARRGAEKREVTGRNTDTKEEEMRHDEHEADGEESRSSKYNRKCSKNKTKATDNRRGRQGYTNSLTKDGKRETTRSIKRNTKMMGEENETTWNKT